MSKPWGGIGAWAAEAERAEEEEREAAAAALALAAPPQTFPSLKEAATTKQPKKKKMSLSQFYADPTNTNSSIGLTPDEMLRLPTGPKERTPEEMQYGGRLGGGFNSYNNSTNNNRLPRGRDNENRRSYGGGFDDERGGQPPIMEQLSSRADEVDNWGAGKKPFMASSHPAPVSQNRYGSLGGSSRADEVDNWGAGKKPFSAPPPVARSSSTFGSGFRESGGPRLGGSLGLRDRPKLVLDPPRVNVVSEVVKVNKTSPFGAARPREEVLAEKGLDWKKVDLEIETKKNVNVNVSSSRPTSSHSSRPSSAQSARSEGVVEGVGVNKPRVKVNPFGDAKPREVLLEEKGKDWRKIDLELEQRRLARPETEEEKLLREEIDHLKMELQKESEVKQDNESLQNSILHKERDLELLIREFDEKVRLGQRAIERPGSGAGRVTGFPERQPSRSGSFEESRNMDYIERPRSRGTADAWARPGDNRRGGYQGGRGGFLGNRAMDRPRSRERW